MKDDFIRSLYYLGKTDEIDPDVIMEYWTGKNVRIIKNRNDVKCLVRFYRNSRIMVFTRYIGDFIRRHGADLRIKQVKLRMKLLGSGMDKHICKVMYRGKIYVSIPYYIGLILISPDDWNKKVKPELSIALYIGPLTFSMHPKTNHYTFQKGMIYYWTDSDVTPLEHDQRAKVFRSTSVTLYMIDGKRMKTISFLNLDDTLLACRKVKECIAVKIGRDIYRVDTGEVIGENDIKIIAMMKKLAMVRK